MVLVATKARTSVMGFQCGLEQEKFCQKTQRGEAAFRQKCVWWEWKEYFEDLLNSSGMPYFHRGSRELSELFISCSAAEDR